MSYCKKCGFDVGDKEFCSKCGTPQKNQTQNINTDTSVGNYVKFIALRVLVGLLILLVGFCGYYIYDKNNNTVSQGGNINKSETTESNKSSTDNGDNNTVKDNNNNTVTDNKETNDSSDYIFSDSADRRLTDDELSSLSKETLALARNEIYARHGYVFETEPYKSYFANETWYKPHPSFKGSDEEINEVERYNVQLISEYEKAK